MKEIRTKRVANSKKKEKKTTHYYWSPQGGRKEGKGIWGKKDVESFQKRNEKPKRTPGEGKEKNSPT